MADTQQVVRYSVEDQDVEFGSYEENREQWPVIPDDTYYAKAWAWNTIAKPDYKQESQLAELRKKHPDATMADIDEWQWECCFRVSRGEHKEFELVYRFNRTTTWHEKATATIVVAALAGLGKYDAETLREKYGSLKGLIATQPESRIVVTLIQSDRDKMWRNYVRDVKPLPVAGPADLFKKKPAAAPAIAQKPASPRVNLIGYPQEDGEDGDFNALESPLAASIDVTEKQIRAIYTIGRAAKRLSESQVDDRCAEVFGVRPNELTKAEASQFIDMLKGEVQTT